MNGEEPKVRGRQTVVAVIIVRATFAEQFFSLPDRCLSPPVNSCDQ